MWTPRMKRKRMVSVNLLLGAARCGRYRGEVAAVVGRAQKHRCRSQADANAGAMKASVEPVGICIGSLLVVLALEVGIYGRL